MYAAPDVQPQQRSLMTATALEYEFDRRPDPGETMEVAAGVRWLRMPLPFILGHINLWLLDDGDGLTIVDTGLHEPDTHAVWNRLLDERQAAVKRVIVTHLHPDHSGCAGWLTERHGVELWMSREEYLLCRVLKMDTGRPAPPDAIDFYRRCGYDAGQLQRFVKRFGRFGSVVSPLPDSYRRLRDGDRVAVGKYDWEVMVGRGHSPEHAALFCRELNLVIAGDQILPTISSNVSVWPTEPEADPLADWLETLNALSTRLPHDVLVLPAHGRPFRGAHRRLRQLVDEHESGLEKLLHLCSQRPQRAVDVFPALFKSKINDGNLMMATGEAVAHLHYLRNRGQLDAHDDADGVRWFTCTDQAANLPASASRDDDRSKK